MSKQPNEPNEEGEAMRHPNARSGGRSRRFAVVLVAAPIAAGALTVAGPAGTAEAHTQNMSEKVTCVDHNYYKVDYTLNFDKGVPPGDVYRRTGTTTYQNGWSPSTWHDWTKVKTVSDGAGSVSWTVTLPGDTKTAPWEYSYVKWHDNYITQGDTRPEDLKGDCGSQNLPKDAAASVNVTQPTCTVRTANVSYNLTHATASPATPDNSPGTHQVTFTAEQNHLFASGSNTMATSYTVNAPPAGDDCAQVVVPTAPQVNQSECTGPGQSSQPQVILASGPAGVSYTYDETTHVVTATADSTTKFADTLPTGWVKVDNHHATYQVTFTSPGDCLVTAVPANMKFHEKCGPGGVAKIPSSPGVDYYLNGVKKPAGSYRIHKARAVGVAKAQPGYQLQGAHRWTKKFSNRSCVVRKPRGHIAASCNGTVKLHLNNLRSNRAVWFTITGSRGGKGGATWAKRMHVRAHHKHTAVIRHVGPHTKLVLHGGGKVLDRAHVPGHCTPPPPNVPPGTGLRVPAGAPLGKE